MRFTPRRVAYPGLAALAGVSCRNLHVLSSEDVAAGLGVAPGSVSPVPLVPGIPVYADADVLTIAPTA